MNVSLDELSFFAKSKNDIYHSLSTIYHLPKLSSKAITNEYLLEISKANSQYLKVPNQEITPVTLEFRKLGTIDLLERLDKLLISKGEKRTGFDLIHFPDTQWIANICRWADSNDTLEVFKKKISLQSTLKREIDPQ